MYQNRSAVSGTSAPAATVFALPLSSDSSSASSSVFSATRSPSRCRRRPRSDGVSRPQGPSSAARAALTARSMSAALPCATCASTSPVPGSKDSNVLPSSASTHLPSISSLRGCAVNCRADSLRPVRTMPFGCSLSRDIGARSVGVGTLHRRCIGPPSLGGERASNRSPAGARAGSPPAPLSPGPVRDRPDRVQLLVARRPGVLLSHVRPELDVLADRSPERLVVGQLGVVEGLQIGLHEPLTLNV
jgi:hypothetical protein